MQMADLPIEFDVMFKHRLAEMVEAELLTFRELNPWADAVILTMDRPPEWVLDLAVTKFQPKVLAVVRRAANASAWEVLPADFSSRLEDDHIAAIYLRYERREISWGSFLRESGVFADNTSGSWPCEYFYSRLNAIEDAEYAEELERTQLADVKSQFSDAIERVRRIYQSVRALAKQVIVS